MSAHELRLAQHIGTTYEYAHAHSQVQHMRMHTHIPEVAFVLGSLLLPNTDDIVIVSLLSQTRSLVRKSTRLRKLHTKRVTRQHLLTQLIFGRHVLCLSPGDGLSHFCFYLKLSPCFLS